MEINRKMNSETELQNYNFREIRYIIVSGLLYACDLQTLKEVSKKYDKPVSTSKHQMVGFLKEVVDISEFVVQELKDLCREWAIEGFSTLRREQLIVVLTNTIYSDLITIHSGGLQLATTPRLKEICRRFGEKCSGNRNELISRLEERCILQNVRSIPEIDLRSEEKKFSEIYSSPSIPSASGLSLPASEISIPPPIPEIIFSISSQESASLPVGDDKQGKIDQGILPPLPQLPPIPPPPPLQPIPEDDIEQPKRKSIPKNLRIKVWNFYEGRKNVDGKCYCCGTEINVHEFECGHVVSVADKGSDVLPNLRPICKLCNRSMGAQNMKEFMVQYGYNVGDPVHFLSVSTTNWINERDYKVTMLKFYLQETIRELEGNIGDDLVDRLWVFFS
jgi:SAP domain/HNH endonuclease